MCQIWLFYSEAALHINGTLKEVCCCNEWKLDDDTFLILFSLPSLSIPFPLASPSLLSSLSPPSDPIFQVKVKEGEALLESLQQPWQVQERALETDVSALRWVEDLERRVIAADLHLKVRRQGDSGAVLQ